MPFKRLRWFSGDGRYRVGRSGESAPFLTVGSVQPGAISSMFFSLFSPPFVPVVAAAIGNRKVMVSVIIVGIVGSVAGNYLGIAVAYSLRAVF